MNKLMTVLLGVAFTANASAQGLFWTFDDNQKPVEIPVECEGKFDEVRGGVFFPSIDELYEYGKTFLSSDELTVQQQGAYCMLSAALQGNANAQFTLAQLYEQGKVLPQDDLSAYKWSFMAALGGVKEAERYTLTLEQFLTTDELERTSGAIQETKRQVEENIRKQLDENGAKLAKEKEELNQLTQEIKSYGNLKPVVAISDAPVATEVVTKSDIPTDAEVRAVMPDVLNVFSEGDRK